MKTIFSFLLFSVCTVIAFGQGFTITGTVTNDTGNVLDGANIVVKGTNNGTFTDVEGKYVLDHVADGSVLQFSFVGYSTQDITVGDERVINVMLKSDLKIDELTITSHNIHNSNVSKQLNLIVESKSDDDDFLKQVSHYMQYLFPEFTNGSVFYKEMSTKGKLNYNILLGEMQFVQNDQLFSLDNVQNVFQVVIDQRKFFPFKGDEFTEEIYSNERYGLRVRYKGNLTTYGKKGGYGMTSPAGSISTVTVAVMNNAMSNNDNTVAVNKFQKVDQMKEDMIITVDYFYYLVGSNGKYVMIKNKNTFTKLFKEHQLQIETFIKEHNVRMNNREDLIKLLEYSTNL